MQHDENYDPGQSRREFGPGDDLTTLKERREELEHLIVESRRERIAELRTQFDTALEADGIDIEEVYPDLGRSARASGRTRPRTRTTPRYRNPDNPEETWSGQGRTPPWVQRICSDLGIEVSTFRQDETFRVDNR